MKATTGLVFLCGFFCACAAMAQLSESRTWTSKRGSKLDAVLLQDKGPQVVLRRVDGTRVQIGVSQLSDADRAFLKTLREERRKTDEKEEEITSVFLSSSKDKAGAGEEEAGEQQEEKPADPQAQAAAAVPGKISGLISVPPEKEGELSKYSYLLYLPKAFTRDRTWPAMFILGPWGARPQNMKLYLAGAERNGWILAMSREAQQMSPPADAQAAALAMIEAVAAGYPINEDRLYVSGFATGCDQAYRLAANKRGRDIAGIVACAGGPLFARAEVPKKTLVYGLSGAANPRRWEMAYCFEKQLKGKRGILKFFPGGYEWAGEPYLTDAMTWLNCRYLERVPRTDKRLAVEKAALLGNLQEEVKRKLEHDPCWAHDWALYLAESGSDISVRKELAKTLKALKQNKEVQTHVKAVKDMERFVARYLAGSPNGHMDEKLQEKITQAAKKLEEEYVGTWYATLFASFGEKPALTTR
jgi:hypothetical protein